MSATSEDMLAVLKSIDAGIKQLLVQTRVAKPKEVAPDSDLDDPRGYGDPIVKAADPRDWTGPSQKGKHFSQCSSEYLTLVADRLDYFADVAERENKVTSAGKPVAPYNRRDAARARGWAARARMGRVPVRHADPVDQAWDAPEPATVASGDDFTDADIPF